jgi:hypothetical protein
LLSYKILSIFGESYNNEREGKNLKFLGKAFAHVTSARISSGKSRDNSNELN